MILSDCIFSILALQSNMYCLNSIVPVILSEDGEVGGWIKMYSGRDNNCLLIQGRYRPPNYKTHFFSLTRKELWITTCQNTVLEKKNEKHYRSYLLNEMKCGNNTPKRYRDHFLVAEKSRWRLLSKFLYNWSHLGSSIYLYTWKQCALPDLTTMALRQLMHLGAWSTVTYCWYQ